MTSALLFDSISVYDAILNAVISIEMVLMLHCLFLVPGIPQSFENWILFCLISVYVKR